MKRYDVQMKVTGCGWHKVYETDNCKEAGTIRTNLTQLDPMYSIRTVDNLKTPWYSRFITRCVGIIM